MRTAYRTCPLCEATCGLAITLDDSGAVTQVRGDADDVFSKGFICPKGVSIKQLHEDPRRLRAPMVRQADGSFAEATWDEAFALIAERLPAIQAEHGRDAVATYIGNPNAHNLSGLIYGRALVKALGSKNVYTASTVDQYPKQAAAAYMFGSGSAVPVPDLDRTSHLLMLGANPAVSNGSLMTAPDVRGRLAAIRERGGKVVVVDPRRTRTAKLADEHVWIRPGTDALLLFALLNVVVEEGLAAPLDDALYAGADTVAALARDFPPEAVAPATGIPAGTMRRLARELAAADRAAVYGRMGTTTQAFGTTASWLVDVLNAFTGNLDRPGGAMWALPAHAPRGTGSGRGARFGRWTSRVRGAPEVFGELPVACLAEEIETPGEGQVRALVTIAGNPVVSTPNAGRLRAALESLDFMVSVDVYLNDTTRHADVILPGPSPLRRAHYDIALYDLAVRNVANWSDPVLPLEGPDEWETLLRLTGIAAGLGPDADVDALDAMVGAEAARRAGVEPDPALRGPERVVDAMLRGGAYGLSLADLKAAPHGIDLGPLEPRLPERLATASGKVELAPEPLVADVERLHAALRANGDGGMVLIGRRHLRSNNSWMNGLPMLASGPDRCTALIHPDDAARLGVADGEAVRVAARTGAIELPAEVTDDVMPGVVSIPHGWEHANSNVLSDERLVEPLTGTAVLNGIPVTVAPLGDEVEERGVLVERGA
ncbi:MAG TPA: molybdopterin-dependent oxidoreductase [Solirubrobacteraceae bacterium]|jgi:anaerobic selenocysteine-containing dehydrogenase|nr:molybdopterin-dependent oxidoreductase [Solirubrobacteraceae bacterium]